MKSKKTKAAGEPSRSKTLLETRYYLDVLLDGKWEPWKFLGYDETKAKQKVGWWSVPVRIVCCKTVKIISNAPLERSARSNT